MNSFTGIFQEFNLYFKNAVLCPPCSPQDLTQAPHQILKSPHPCSQHLRETLEIEGVDKTWKPQVGKIGEIFIEYGGSEPFANYEFRKASVIFHKNTVWTRQFVWT